MEDQLRVEVCSSSIMASLQVLDDCGCLVLVQEIRQLRKHLLRKVPDLLVRPSPRLGQRKDRRKLLRGETTGGSAVPFSALSIGVSVGGIAVAISIGVGVSI